MGAETQVLQAVARCCSEPTRADSEEIRGGRGRGRGRGRARGRGRGRRGGVA